MTDEPQTAASAEQRWAAAAAAIAAALDGFDDLAKRQLLLEAVGRWIDCIPGSPAARFERYGRVMFALSDMLDAVGAFGTERMTFERNGDVR